MEGEGQGKGDSEDAQSHENLRCLRKGQFHMIHKRDEYVHYFLSQVSLSVGFKVPLHPSQKLSRLSGRGHYLPILRPLNPTFQANGTEN